MNGHGNGGIAFDERRGRSKGSIGARIASVALGVSLMVGALGVPSAQAHGTMDIRDRYFHAVSIPNCQNFQSIGGYASTVTGYGMVSFTRYWRATIYRATTFGGPATRWGAPSPWYPGTVSTVANLGTNTGGYYWILFEFWWPGIYAANQTHQMWSVGSCHLS